MVPDTVLFVGVQENAVLVMVPVELHAMFVAVKDDFEVDLLTPCQWLGVRMYYYPASCKKSGQNMIIG